LANVLFAQELAVRVASKSILVNSIHPGGVDTELGRHLLDALENYAGKTISQFVADYVMPKAGSGTWHPKDAALTQVFAAVAPKLISAKTTGKYFHPIARETTPDPHAANVTLQRGLWALTEAFIASH
jgi:NAD(P)-dependent dehydrogenase (short-subunit alcohol dehydrogenase family)